MLLASVTCVVAVAVAAVVVDDVVIVDIDVGVGCRCLSRIVEVGTVVAGRMPTRVWFLLRLPESLLATYQK